MGTLAGRVAFVGLTLMVAWGLPPAPASATTPAATPAPVSRDAFGVVLAGRVTPGIDARQRLDRVGSTWYYDYSARLDDEPVGYHKVGMVRGGEDNRADLPFVAEQARKRPGHAWLVFNEPDLVGQDAVSDTFLSARGETRFAYYARLLYRYATTIKQADPTATLVGPNLFNAYGRGSAWLGALRDVYQQEYGADLPFDVLGVHLYAFDPTWTKLPQLDLAQNERFLAEALEFASQLPGHPRVWVTEVGSLWIYGEVRCVPNGGGQQCAGSTVAWPQLTVFTTQVVRSMSAAGVERWFFFSTNPVPDPWASVPNATYLADERNELTPVGQAWRDAVRGPADTDWAPGRARQACSAVNCWP